MAINAEIDSDNLLVNSHVAYYHSYMYKSMLNVADVSVAVAESDVLRVVDGISNVFCQEHRLKMNSSFNAFQMKGTPEISNIRKHIRLKKSMSLPDDTLEYWGFYLPKGSSVVLSVCSRFDGSRILVVKGEKNLHTCGLLEHTARKAGVNMAQGEGQVRVTFETDAQEIYSESTAHIRLAAEENRKQVMEDENVGNNSTGISSNASSTPINVTDPTATVPSLVRRSRHAKKRLKELEQHHKSHSRDQWERRKMLLEETLMPKENMKKNYQGGENAGREKRYLKVDPKNALDGGIAHGGNANNYSVKSSESSVSSFENGLLTCYDGQILLAQSFPPSHLCTDVHFLEKGGHMQTTHEVVSDGYYYYIFYSDNDNVLNDIHAVFNIYKPTYQYANYSKGCINKTECNFPLNFLSAETVIVEVPTRDGIEHEQDDISLLISSCHPRMSVYIIFPVTVLFLILGCAFL
ncbi:Lytic amidase [Frankliniella fusca]|uniref:Lytic amidase n=1 Tax=Frankliniella fusca TaxID=407009 RepID=A0AAE1HD60_9NEOP|nr:Lytic amidase [Frankliniella fusca]